MNWDKLRWIEINFMQKQLKINVVWWILSRWIERNWDELVWIVCKNNWKSFCLMTFAEMNWDELKSFAISSPWNDKFCNSWLKNCLKPFATMFDKKTQHLRRHQCKIALQHFALCVSLCTVVIVGDSSNYLGVSLTINMWRW